MRVIPAWVEALLFVVLVTAACAAIYFVGRADGGADTNAAWQSRENTTLQKANARIVELEEDARRREATHAQDMAAAAAQYQKEKAHVEADRDRTIADLRSGALRLRIPIAAACAGTVGGTAAAPGAGAGRSDDPTTAELSAAAAEFLVGLAAEADAVVNQLTACQAVVIADRKAINQGEEADGQSRKQ